MIIAITNQKGGSCKSSTALHLGAALLELNPKARLALIDLDYQADLFLFDGCLGKRAAFEAVPLAALPAMIERHKAADWVLLDSTKSALAYEVQQMAKVADRIIVPTDCEYNSLRGAVNVADILSESGAAWRVLFNKYNGGSDHRQSVRELKELFPENLFKTKVPYSRQFGATVRDKTTALAALPDSKLAGAYRELAKEVMKW